MSGERHGGARPCALDEQSCSRAKAAPVQFFLSHQVGQGDVSH